jgi:hypothetical protein
MASRRQHPFETQLHRQRVACERRLCALTRGLRHRAKSPRRASPCFGNPAAGPQDCPTAPVGTAARARAPTTAAQSRRSSELLSRRCVLRIYINGIWHCVNSNRAPSAAHDTSQICRDCGMARRSLFASLKVLSGWRMTTGTRSARPNASRCLRASWRNSGARPVRRPWLPGRGLAQQAVGVPLRIVEHAEAHPLRGRECAASEACRPGGAARIEDGPRRLPDHPFLPSGTAAPHTTGQPTRSALTALPPPKPPVLRRLRTFSFSTRNAQVRPTADLRRVWFCGHRGCGLD